MDEKKSQIGLYIAIIALLVGVANIFLGVLPTVELKGKAEQLESRVARADKIATKAWNKAREIAKRQSAAPAVAPKAPLPMPETTKAPAPKPKEKAKPKAKKGK